MNMVEHLPPLLFAAGVVCIAVVAMTLVLFLGIVAPSYWRRST
jgi:fumarate reductase subunit D